MAALIALADVITKEVVQARFAFGERMEVASFFNLVFWLNPGAAFGFLANAGGWQKPILVGLGAIVSSAIAVWILRGSMSRMVAFGLAAILGGAVGNVIDRARHGAVVDWLDLHVAGWHWPAFNIADIGITVGAGLLILDGLFVAPRKSASRADTADRP
ncbi:MAG: lipoprotein signal peptidase [Burkholderiales bacterium]|nr:lipoprotein signal peptidase [Burkholderiales bacterium]